MTHPTAQGITPRLVNRLQLLVSKNQQRARKTGAEGQWNYENRFIQLANRNSVPDTGCLHPAGTVVVCGGDDSGKG